MKILKLEFSNINSLKGHHFIDFTDSAFTENSIFAITGNTGSGKSTILDAITLALFHKTARTNSISDKTNEIMTKGTFFCESHLTFEIANSIYIASFKQRKKQRVKKGNTSIFETKKVTLSEIDKITNEVKVISDKNKDCLAIIEDKTGLNFERFTRAVMLCQGNFASFLHADKSNKVAILEKLSDTKKYNDISTFIFEYHKKAEQDIKNLQDELQAFTLLSNDDLIALNEEITSLEANKNSINIKINKLREDENNKKRFNELINNKNQILLEENNLKDRFALEDINTLKLKKAKSANEINAFKQTLMEFTKNISKQEKDKKENESTLIALFNERDNIQKSLKDAKDSYEQIKDKNKKEQDLITKASFLDEEIKKTSCERKSVLDYINKESKNLDDKNKEYDDFNHDLESKKLDLSHKKELLAKLNLDVSDITQNNSNINNAFTNLKDKALSANNNVAQIESLNKELLSLDKTLQEQNELCIALTHEKDLKQKELDDAISSFKGQNFLSIDEIYTKKEELNKKQNTIKELQKNNKLFAKNISSFIENINIYIAHNKNLEHLKREYIDISSHIKTTDALVTSIQNEIQNQNIIKSLKEHRNSLLDNTPCPLCGSLDHPYCINNVDKSLNNDLENTLKNTKKDLDNLNYKLTTLNKDISKDEERNLSLQKDINALYKDQKDFLNQDLNSLSIGLYIENIFNLLEKDIDIAFNAFNKLDDFNALLIQEQCKNNLTNINNMYKDYLNELALEIKTFDTNIKTINEFNLKEKSLLKEIKTIENKINSIKEPLLSIEKQNERAKQNIEHLNATLKQNKDEIYKILHVFLENIFNRYTLSLFKDNKELFSSFIKDKDSTLSFDNLDYDNKDIKNLIKSYTASFKNINSKCFKKDNIDLLLSFLNNYKDFNAFDALLLMCENTKNTACDFLDTLKKTFINLNKDIENSDININTLSLNKTSILNAIVQIKTTLDEKKSNLTKLDNMLQETKDKRFKTLNVIDLKSYKNKIDLDLKNKEDEVLLFENKKIEINENIARCKSNIDGAIKYIKDTTPFKENAENDIKKLLKENSFNTIHDIDEFLLSKDEFIALEEEILFIKDKKKELKFKLNNLDENICALEKSIDTNRELESFSSEITKLEQDIEEITTKKMEISHKINADKELKSKNSDVLAKLDNAKAKFKNIAILNDLIGSKSGEKFSLFVQTLSLNYIIKLANLELNKLTNRYILVNHDNESLDFDVIDRYRGNIQRSSSNLSGGETFLVSLALALALSKMASQKIQIDSLFLDEGFGTLDDETLSIALGALNSMRTEGKLIGIISHVAKLKENIKTQIEVKQNGDGTSKLYLNDKKLSD